METVRKKTYRFQWVLVAMILAISLQTGCGQKGPLYLPDKAVEKTPNNE